MQWRLLSFLFAMSVVACLPSPRPSMLTACPLREGASWTYGVTIDYVENNRKVRWTGWVTEMVIRATPKDNGWVLDVERQGYPDIRDAPESSWRYVVLGDRLYRLSANIDPGTVIASNGKGFESDLVLYAAPTVDQQWGDPQMLQRGDGKYVWRVENKESVPTPSGDYTDCYRLALYTNSDSTLVWFCPGNCIVRKEYHQRVTSRDEVWVLQQRLVGKTNAP